MQSPPRPGRSTSPRTALALPVPTADPVLRAVAARYPETVRTGVPAHLTVLYPFLPVDELTPAVEDRCAEIAAGIQPIPVRFTRCSVRPGLVYLAPEPADEIRQVLQTIRSGWPHIVLYDGRHTEAPDHVSLALDPRPVDVPDIVTLVENLLPITAELSVLIVAALVEREWKVRSQVPLGGR